MIQQDDAGPEREAWDYEIFVRHYNERAHERGGWEYDFPRSGPSPEKLRGYYESPIWDSLRDFALTRYELDQEV